jgi:DNA-binding PadR family transcriptional regulator
MTDDDPAVEGRLPLTPVVFEILLALAEDARHGYAIMQEVEHRSEGRINLHPGTLYRALGRLLDEGMIEELSEAPAGSADDPHGQRRRYYRLTRLGRAVAEAEARRLASQVSAARIKRLLLPGARS